MLLALGGFAAGWVAGAVWWERWQGNQLARNPLGIVGDMVGICALWVCRRLIEE